MIDAPRLPAASALLALITLVVEAGADPTPLDAKVAWVRDGRVYVAAADSIALQADDVLTFLDRGRRIATARVARIYDRDLAVATLVSGSLARVKRPERLQILAERPPLPAARLLRVGYPAASRLNLLFECGRVTIRLPPSGAAYRIEEPAERSCRLVRDPARAVEAPWPDTLMIRLFDEPTDEEIALERGELDVAVFWPGEASLHLRADSRWQGGVAPNWTRGVVAAIRLGPDPPAGHGPITAADRLPLAALSREMFRGDLAPWPGWEAGLGPDPGSDSPRVARFEVDSSCPGRPVLERFLNRGRSARAGGDTAGVVRVFYLEGPARRADSLALGVAEYVRRGGFGPALRARADTLAAAVGRLGPDRGEVASERLLRDLAGSLHVELLFAIRCPVVCAQELRRYVDALGPDAFVDLIGCEPTRHGP